jgi:hypothetical protein
VAEYTDELHVMGALASACKSPLLLLIVLVQLRVPAGWTLEQIDDLWFLWGVPVALVLLAWRIAMALLVTPARIWKDDQTSIVAYRDALISPMRKTNQDHIDHMGWRLAQFSGTVLKISLRDRSQPATQLKRWLTNLLTSVGWSVSEGAFFEIGTKEPIFGVELRFPEEEIPQSLAVLKDCISDVTLHVVSKRIPDSDGYEIFINI